MKMIDQLKEIVYKNGREREIQEFLKSNMSDFGNIFSVPENEYIICSEYPIGKGNVDFAVFTNRSKLEIKLIEIKGANFNFLTSKNTINSNIRHAEEQLLERFDFIDKTYESFRREVHEIKDQILNGSKIYNSAIGSSKKILCDPRKDIIIRGFVIGGRTIDDLVESKKKYQLQKNFNMKISYESWDSFFRKIVDKGNIEMIHKKMIERANVRQTFLPALGSKVKSLVDYVGVPKGTGGVVDEHWQSCDGIAITVAWDLPTRPLPSGYKKYSNEHKVNVLRDGFTPNEFDNLEFD